MSSEERAEFIGTWLSKSEKQEVQDLAKGMDISVSELIRHRVIRPFMTLPEAITNMKLYIDHAFNRFRATLKTDMSQFVQENLLQREPIRRTFIEEYEPRIIVPIKREIVKTQVPKEKALMTEVIKELKQLFESETWKKVEKEVL